MCRLRYPDSGSVMNDASSTQHGFERNLRLYPWYVVGFNAFAWMPIFFLYFSERMSLERVLQLEAIYYAVVVLLEVPSGYFSDVVGRRVTLIISSAALIGAYVLFVIDSSFAVFVGAQVLLAMGISFNSGTDTSFHYDSLASLNREQEFASREAVVARNGLLSSALAALVGGCAGAFGLHYAYVASAVAAIGTFVIVLMFVEPRSHERATFLGSGVVRQLSLCLGYLRHKSLAWLFGFAVLMTVLNHIPYEFYQPYIKLTTADFQIPGAMATASAPAVAGVHMALAMLIGAFAAANSIRIRDRVGIGPTLLLSVALQTAMIAVMAVALNAWIIPVVLLRVAPRGLMTAPLNAAITPRVPQAQRATYLSIQSLVGRLSFAGVLLGLSALAGGGAAIDWPSLKRMLFACSLFAVVGLFLLLITQRWCFSAQHESSTPRQDS